MHDQILSLIKFCDIETGLKILNGQSLRWSAPHLFNDPFELDYHSGPDFTQRTLATGLIKEAITLLFGPSDPRGRSNHLVAAVARWREEERFASEEEAETVLTQLLGQLAEQQQEKVDQFLQTWRQFARSLRVCCFCDKPGNMAAWQRYANNHAGIALKFAAGEDSSLSDPRRVTYSTTPPFVTNLKEQVAIAYGRQSPPTPDDFIEKMLSKNRNNNAEREWRCFDTEQRNGDEDDQLWYSNKIFKTHELKAVYLGVGIRANDKDKVLELLRRDYKNTRIFQAETLPGKYEIDFTQLSSK